MKVPPKEPQTIQSIQNISPKHNTSIIKKIICPQCKVIVPLVENITMTSKAIPMITFRCKCMLPKKDDSIDLDQYMNFLKSQEIQDPCFKHSEQIGSIFCKNCSLYMCNKCYSYHYVFGPTHITELVKTITENEACSVHLNQILDFYCEDCNENLCIECSKNSHFSHKVIQLREYWEKTKKKINISSMDELNSLLSKQTNTFNRLIKMQLEKIQSMIINLQLIKTKFENFSKKVADANKTITEFTSLLFLQFFQTQRTPSYSIIETIERVQIEEISSNEEESLYVSIYSKMEECIRSLMNSGCEFFNKTIVKLVKRNDQPINSIPSKISPSPLLHPDQILPEQQQISEVGQILYSENEKEKMMLSAKYSFNDDNNTIKRNTLFTTDCSSLSTKEEKTKIIKKEDILKTLDILSCNNLVPSGNIILQTNSPKDNLFINKKTRRSGSKKDSNESEQSLIKEPNQKQKITQSDRKGINVLTNKTIIKIPLNFLEQKEKEERTITSTDENIIKVNEKEKENVENNKQARHRVSPKTQNNIKENFTSNDRSEKNQKSKDHVPLKPPSSAFIFNHGYDSLANMFFNDNQSKCNFEMNQSISMERSRKSSMDFNWEKNNDDDFRKIFFKSENMNKTFSQNDNTMKFDYKIQENQFEHCINIISEHKSAIHVLSQLSDGLLVSGGKDSVFNFYDGNNGYECVSHFSTNKIEIISFLQLYDNDIALGFADNTIKIYELSNKKCITILIGHSKPVTSIAQKDVNTIISSSEDHTLKMWDLSSKLCLSTFDEHIGSVTSLTILNDSIFVSASNDCSIKIWKYSQSKSLHTIKAHDGPITKIITLDNNKVASASYDKTIKIWDIIQRICIGTLIGHSDKISSIIHLNDGCLASASFDCSIKIWDLHWKSCQKTIISSSQKVIQIIQLFDGSIVTAADDNLIKVWV